MTELNKNELKKIGGGFGIGWSFIGAVLGAVAIVAYLYDNRDKAELGYEEGYKDGYEMFKSN